jgi:signal peptidase I
MNDPRPAPGPKKTTRMTCQGLSMSPMIKNGDEILVLPAGVQDIRFGDIVLYVKNGALLSHRFLGFKHRPGQAPLLLTKGDNASNCDDPFPASQIAGKVIEIKSAGKLINVQKSPWPGIFFMTAVFSFLEWKIYRVFFGERGISPGLKKIIKPLIQGPKRLLYRMMFFMTQGK